MSGHKARVDAMKVLIAGSPVSARPRTTIETEFQEVFEVRRMKRAPRKHLLQVLYSTRAIDTFLSEIIRSDRQTPPHALGKLLDRLRDVGLEGNRRGCIPPAPQKLPRTRCSHYKTHIANVRNGYMHQAGTYPANTAVLANLLSEMEACIQEVTALW